jgi:Raf kinase inhibitor-like YbhB/YbcL family protein
MQDKVTLLSLVVLITFLVSCTSQSTLQYQENKEESIMKLLSPAFEHNGNIPSKFTCDGENINPELLISKAPQGTLSLVLIMDDPDIPQEIKESRRIQTFDHWVLFNIPPGAVKISENSIPGMQGVNSAGNNAHTGPCPPPQYQPTTHRYFFKLYALDITLNLPEGSTKEEVETAMQGHIIEQTELIGKYDRS